ncbi:hypothetical protein NTE_03165 [Candidatus Nitrososphaera evergladensis SR1]|uniref:Uncharacterized protein n=1 Tax=Candidatus Nitrososphaera evergladensis SR1 TaxID=1459636 RepID=A0A075MX26_9ARCH|nr:hypothetical protein [Candidatus Nitrososphaera evergladensis]AIF85197.1 hypothetical protein NTE_03165 [Candidatus Nitrososphaera evergladensis SR1]
MPVLSDSYMGLFMPADIPSRITRFIAGQADFPYIKREETIGAFFIFGKDGGVHGDSEVGEARDLAKRTVEQAAKDIRMYASMPGRLDSAFTRENYTKRMLQIAVDSRGLKQEEINERVAGDPTILSDCFAQHVAFYKQEFYFEIFGPLKKYQLPPSLQQRMESRMILLGYNAKNARALPFANSLEAFFAWLKSH